MERPVAQGWLRRLAASRTIAPVTAGGNSLPFVSVVLAVRDDARYLPRCLEALVRQTYPQDRLEALVVDGCSRDGSRAIAQGFADSSPLVRVLDNPARLTPAGFNHGIRAARGEVIVILGARAEAAPDFVAESVAALERNGADAVGGVVDSDASPDAGSATARAIALALRSPFGVGDARYRYTTREQETDTVNYGAYRRQVFARIGLFDESLAWVEDDEFNYRLRAAGGRLLVSPRIRVRYYARPTLGALWRQQFRWGLNKPKVARRHPAQMRPRHAVPPLFVLSVALSAAGAPFLRPARRALAAVLGAYALAAGAATLLAAAKAGPEPPGRQERQGRHGEIGTWRRWRPGGSRWVSKRTIDRRALLRLPLAFATMHVAYGSGMLIGLARALWPGGKFTAEAQRRGERLESGD